MLRLFIYLAVIVALAMGLSWLADRPGNLVINWEGRVIETSVFYAVVLLSALLGAVLLTWSILRHIWESPAAIGSFLSRRKEKRGLDSLSSGMIAIGAGDRSGATRYAIQARKTLPNEPLTHLLRAQAAQLSGDKATARRIYEGMLNTPDTEQLGLRGLFLEAEREGELEAARQFAERAVRLNPKLTWPVDSLFELQCKTGDWAGALETTAIARKNGQIEKNSADRRRAVLLTAQAQVAEDSDPERALQLATEAHGLAADLVPAAAIAGRVLASRGNTPKATKVIQKTWQKAPHPDLAVAYAYSRLGDSPKDRLDRVKKLAALNPYSLEGPVAVANAAIEAKDYEAARTALEPLLENRLTQRVCTLMARIEGEEFGDKGRVREWLARAVNAPRDPAWTADGMVSEHWAPVSPVSGALDAFQWRVPVESAEKSEADLIAKKLEELVALGAPSAAAVAAAGAGALADTDVAAAVDVPVAERAGASTGMVATGSVAKPDKSDVADADIVDEAPAAKPSAAPKTASPAADEVAATQAQSKESAASGVAAKGSGGSEKTPSTGKNGATKTEAKVAAKDESASRQPRGEPAADAPAIAKESELAEAEAAPGKPEASLVAGMTPNTDEPSNSLAADKLAIAEKVSEAGHQATKKAGDLFDDVPGSAMGPVAGLDTGRSPKGGEPQGVKAGHADRTPKADVVSRADPVGGSSAGGSKIFVPPRPPDDPGPDDREQDPSLPTRPTYPVSS